MLRLSESRAMLVSAMPSMSSIDEVNAAIKREQSDACISYAEHEQYRRSQFPAEGGRKKMKEVMKIRSYTAVAMLASGVGLSIAGFIAPPFGEISDSVLWFLRLRREPAHARHCSCKHGIALA